ncbi:hypothetical protein tb265_35840 [Gemmatimonadetes bacterium T265]|nr:hypothetical protein tb265_35840 [Gemmatimonadetes bacterium T265]
MNVTRRGDLSERGGARALLVEPGTGVVVAVLLACAALPSATAAQVPAAPRPAPRDTTAPRPTRADTTVRNTTQRDTTPRDTVRRETTRRDTTARDTTARARRDSTRRDSALFVFAPEDSLMQALRARRNYDVVRYQGDTVKFGARDRVLTLRGKPSAVQRDSAILVGPTIRYDDSLQVVTASVAGGAKDSVVLRDPSQGSDVVVRDAVRYNLAERRGVVRGFSTSATQGETWYVQGGRAAFAAADSLTTPNVPKGAEGQRVFYAHDASVTSCNEEVPHYHFVAHDVKMVSKRLLVIRPATLYIGDVPVLWLPFVYQDTRPGRRSGLLRPVFGPAELLRNSPTYQRSVRHFGYYTNLGDYADASAWIDYRSGARPGGYYGYGEFTTTVETRYRSIDRQLSGDLAVKRTSLTSGLRSLDVSFDHAQQFTQDRSLRANINYSQNTTVQRINTFDPNQVLGTIRSNAAYTDRYGPVSASLSGAATEYAGRPDRTLDFPQLTLNSRTISVTPWLDWTPTLSLTNSQSFRLTQATQFSYLYHLNAAGNVDSTRVNASTRQTTLAFGTPIKVFGFSIGLPVNFTENVTNAPQRLPVFANINDSTTRQYRVFNQTFTSSFDVSPSISLPSLFQGTWNLSPNVNLVNVDQGGLLFRSQYSGGKYVTAAKRLTYGLTAAPTLYAFIHGFGAVERFRNSINPTLTYSFSPKATVSDEYLRATGATRQGYLGALKQNRITLGFSTNLEAKLRARPAKPAAGDTAAGFATTGRSAGASPTSPLPPDSTTRLAAFPGPQVPNAPILSTGGGSTNDERRVLKVVSLNFSSLSYDFVRKDSTGRGFVDPTFSYSATSDLLPGFSLRSDYSLYLGDPTSDTARFKPYRTGTSVTFQLDRNSGLFGVLSRLFGIKNGRNTTPTPSPTQTAPGDVAGGDPEFARQAAASRVAGSRGYDARNAIVPQQFTLGVTYTESRQRPDIRGGTTIANPYTQCSGFAAGQEFLQSLCIAQAQTTGLGNTTQLTSSVRGSAIYITPPQQSLSVNSAFHITQKWGAGWNTIYDVYRKQFASNSVQLQRELHDWRANFNFTQSPNGNFAFSFAIALKAEPDLKFDYNRQTVRSAQP